jgi:ceramide glucosyltransferase
MAATWTALGLVLGGLACASAAYSLVAALFVRRFFQSETGQTPELPAAAPTVTILKPLSGDEPRLRAHLESFCRQDYPGDVQIVFGVQDSNDPAIRCVEALQRDFPDRDLQLVVSTREYGSNRKISNVINIAREARHDVLVLADSDVGVGPAYVRDIVTALSAPGVGLVTRLYRGEPLSGLWSQLSAMAIDHHFLPSVIVGLATKRARPCFGSTIALRRSVLERAGGFNAFANCLADDNAIGEAVRGLGLLVAIPPMTVTHACTERSLADLVAHELRWARTIRTIDPVGFAGSIVTHPLPLGLVSAAASGFSPAAATVLLVALACRAALLYQVDRSLGVQDRRWWLWPVRDVLSFIIFLATFFGRSVTWRKRRFRVEPNGMLSSLKGQ